MPTVVFTINAGKTAKLPAVVTIPGAASHPDRRLTFRADPRNTRDVEVGFKDASAIDEFVADDKKRLSVDIFTLCPGAQVTLFPNELRRAVRHSTKAKMLNNGKKATTFSLDTKPAGDSGDDDEIIIEC